MSAEPNRYSIEPGHNDFRRDDDGPLALYDTYARDVAALREQVKKLTAERDRIAIEGAYWRSDMEAAGKRCGQRDDEYPLAAVIRVLADRDKLASALLGLLNATDNAVYTRGVVDMDAAAKEARALLPAETPRDGAKGDAS